MIRVYNLVFCISACSMVYAMQHQESGDFSLTMLDQVKSPDAQLLVRGDHIITMQELIERGKRPVMISIYNGSNAPVSISSESCTGVEPVSLDHIMESLAHPAVKKSAFLLSAAAILTAISGAIIMSYAGKDLYRIFKETVLVRARERADKKQQQLLAAGQEVAGWLSFLPIPYMTTLYRLLAKRKQLLPFIKRTIPQLMKKLAARATGSPYVDDAECKEVVSELAVRSTGSILAVLYKYLELVDVEEMLQVIRAQTPVASVGAVAGVVGICATPFYLHELQFSNYQLRRQLKKKLLSNKIITIMPKQTVQQLMVLPGMATDQFKFRIFDHAGIQEKAEFVVKLG